jgi:vesicle-associated membrane protein 7
MSIASFGLGSEHSLCRHMFHILQSDGLVFLAMSDSGFERRIAYAFLEEIKTRYLSIPPERSRAVFNWRRFLRSYGDIGQTAAAYAMNKSFSRVLKEQMVRACAGFGAGAQDDRACDDHAGVFLAQPRCRQDA